MYVTPETFERHLQFLTAHFTILTFRRAAGEDGTAGDWDNAARYCVLTFDDGWLDNYQYAYPLLRAYSAPATIFLPTGLIGSSDWLWPDRLGELLRRRRRGRAEDWDAQIERAKDLSDEDRDDLIDAIAARSATPARGRAASSTGTKSARCPAMASRLARTRQPTRT